MSTPSPSTRLPWWVGVPLGVGCAALGAVLVLRPFDSLSVLVLLVAIGAFAMGASSIADASRADRRWPGLAAGLVWIGTGVLVLAWPDITTTALAIVVGISLIVGGVLDVLAAVRRTTDERLAALVSGLASVIFGVLAISWPSVTVLVIAIVFGFRLVLFGLRFAWASFRDRAGGADAVSEERSPGKLRRFAHVAVASVSLVVALGLAGVSAMLNEGEPQVEAFYDTPAEVPDQPGQLLDAEEFTRTIPSTATAWRILYTTTRADGVPAVASALVVTPRDTSGGPAPVIALAHGTTGVDRSCAPSLLDDPFEAGAFFVLDQVIDEGWAVVATDYVGLGTEGGHPYLVGQPAGRSVLDSVRAARQLSEAQLGDETVVWGHSQGGGAALWTGGLAPTYAPDVNVIGVAALAPASDLVGLVGNLGTLTGGTIFATYVLAGYATEYDDVRVSDYVRPTARTSFDAAVGRCLAEPAALLSVIGAVTLGDTIFSAELGSGPLLERLEENVPTLPIEVPLLVGQGEADQLVVPSVQTAYVASRCEAGQAIDYRTYPGLDHVPLVEPDSPLIPELLAWTQDRLAGADPTPSCGD